MEVRSDELSKNHLKITRLLKDIKTLPSKSYLKFQPYYNSYGTELRADARELKKLA